MEAPWASLATCSRGLPANQGSCPPLQKCIRFNPDATVWVAKQRILCSLNQSLKDVLNYGLFQPASNGRDGKFLDEERLLREYPQPVGKGIPSLEVLLARPEPARWGAGGAFPDSGFISYAEITLKSIVCIGELAGGSVLVCGPGGTRGKESACQCRRRKRRGFDPWVGKIPWTRAWQPTPGFLPGESHGQRSLVGYSPYSCKESDTTEATWQAHVQRVATCFLAVDRTNLLEGRPAAGMSCCERTLGLTQAHVPGTFEFGGAEWGLPLPH